VIVDNEALRPYLIPSVQRSAILIPYPGDHAELTGLPATDTDNPYCLTICRIEPENNCHMLLAAFAEVGSGSYIFVGNWDDSEYGRQLRLQFGSRPGMDLREPTYDQENLTRLRGGCNLYLHGHSVGGTNPSLVEMLFFDCPILAFDCAFNRTTAEDGVDYFADQPQLKVALESLVKDRGRATGRVQKRERIRREKYTRDVICSAYVALIRSLIR
jgi:glycosyltransferase involved in cell wall biosynthesis